MSPEIHPKSFGTSRYRPLVSHAPKVYLACFPPIPFWVLHCFWRISRYWIWWIMAGLKGLTDSQWSSTCVRPWISQPLLGHQYRYYSSTMLGQIPWDKSHDIWLQTGCRTAIKQWSLVEYPQFHLQPLLNQLFWLPQLHWSFCQCYKMRQQQEQWLHKLSLFILQHILPSKNDSLKLLILNTTANIPLFSLLIIP